MPSSILVDIGNTNTKWKFDGNYFTLPTENFEFEKLPESSKVWVSNVSKIPFEISANSVTFVNAQDKYKSLINAYSKPTLLGCDRWLGMIASYELLKEKSFVLVDIGTAITIDVVNKSGAHLGGLIFPGVDKLRQTFDNFPVSSSGFINSLGRSTQEAWSNGTLSLVVNTINQKIKEIKNEIPNISVFITGGGYLGLKSFLDFDHAYHKNIVLDGLQFYVDYVG